MPFSALILALYEPNWDSLDSRPLPDWYDDAKFGIFVHWGVFSVPSWGPLGSSADGPQASEWYWYNWKSNKKEMETYKKFHNNHYGEHFEYADFVVSMHL